jgi:hypothetical protein
LRQAEWRSDPQFTEESFQLIYRHTEGVPRRINTLCSRLLLHGFLEELHILSASTVDMVANDLRNEIGAVASAPVTILAEAEKPGTGGAAESKLSRARSSATLPGNVSVSPSLSWWRYWRGPSDVVLAKASGLLVIATLLLAIIIAIQSYILEITGASNWKVSQLLEVPQISDKSILSESPRVLQSMMRSDWFSPQPSEGLGDWDQAPDDKRPVLRNRQAVARVASTADQSTIEIEGPLSVGVGVNRSVPGKLSPFPPPSSKLRDAVRPRNAPASLGRNGVKTNQDNIAKRLNNAEVRRLMRSGGGEAGSGR